MTVLLTGIIISSVLIFIYRNDRLNITNIEATNEIPLIELEQSINQSESRVSGLRDNTQKKIIWFDTPRKTELSVLYIHGLSASANEISPIPETIANSLHANLYFSRLTGHGGDGQTLAAATAEDWLADFKQSWHIATLLGHKVIIIASSTGATLTECFLERLVDTETLVSLVYVSPNFGVNHPLSSISSWPFSQHWLPMLLGPIHKGNFENDLQQTIWTYNYPVAVFRQMQRLIDAMYLCRKSPVNVPVLVFLCEEDQAVSANKTKRFLSLSHLSYDCRFIKPIPGSRNHVITGNAMRPETNQSVINDVLAYIDRLNSNQKDSN